MKSRILNITIALIGACVVQAQAQAPIEVTGFQTPESVVACEKYLFVSNMGGLDPTAKNGEGFISQLDRETGKLISLKFIGGLNAPKGLFMKHGLLYVADVDKVVAYNLKTRKQVWSADFSKLGINYLNDITGAGCGSIFVSSTDKNAIYKVNKKGKIKQLAIKGELAGANGIQRKCCKLYVANYGRGDQPSGSFGKVCLMNKKYKAYKTGGIYDGIIKTCGPVIVADWVSTTEGKGVLKVYKPCSKKGYNVAMGTNLNGPSDIYKDCKTKLVWIPAMRDNKLIAISMKEIKKQGKNVKSK